MTHADICDALRTPIGRYSGALSSVRADDLGAVPLRALMARHPRLDWGAVDDVTFGCANQAGEDNRDVARMSLLLAGLPQEVSGVTVNRLCGSGMDAPGSAARAIRAGEAHLMIAGGVESMSRAPFVMPKAESAFSRANAVYDTTIGWRFVNKLMREAYSVDSMPETAEDVAAEFGIEREAQDRMALASQLKAVTSQQAGLFDAEITPVTIAQKTGDPLVVSRDEQHLVRRHDPGHSASDLRGLRALLYDLDVYPERHHHPREEQCLFPAIRARTHEADAVLGQLAHQHAGGETATRTLEQLLLRYEEGGEAAARIGG